MRVLRAYALAIASATFALLLTLIIPPLREQFRYLMFALAVVCSATGGIGPGVFATVLSAAMASYFLIPPVHSFAISDPRDRFRWFLFCGVGLLITSIVRRLQHSAETIRTAAAVVESSADSIILQDLDSTIQSWNKAAEQLYGYTAKEAIGRPVPLIVPPDRREELQRLLEHVYLGGSFRGHETVRIKKDGTRIDVALTLSPVRDRKGKVIGVSSIAQEITERKRAEEALRWSREKLEMQTHQLKLLVEMGNLLQASSTPAEAYAVAARFAQKLIPVISGAVFAYSPATKEFGVVSRWGEEQADERDYLGRDECWGLRTGHAHFVQESQTNLHCRHLPDPPPACYICAPMIAHGETFGLLHLHLRLSEPQQASSVGTLPGSVEFPWPATTIADQLALALANMTLREALRSQSIRDPLTGWFNRRYMEETLEREILRASRSRRPLAVIMLDVDNFKEFNDTFQHEAGDMVLQNLCQTLKNQVRNEDVACRYGGDEFLLVLPDTSAELAAKRAEELSSAASHLDIPFEGRLLAPLTLSIGIAAYPEDGKTLKDLLRAADAALYRAKSEKQDRGRWQEQGSDPTTRI